MADAEKQFCDKKKILSKSDAVFHKNAINIAYDKSVKEYELAKMKSDLYSVYPNTMRLMFFRHKYFFVIARNNDVKTELREIYSRHSYNIEPDIFCIANQDYRGSDIQSKNSDALALAIRYSGVPELRSFCHSIMAKAKFGEANHYIRDRVFGLVKSLELWLDVATKQDRSLIPARCGEALTEVIPLVSLIFGLD